jgi:hypothetical protein
MQSLFHQITPTCIDLEHGISFVPPPPAYRISLQEPRLPTLRRFVPSGDKTTAVMGSKELGGTNCDQGI